MATYDQYGRTDNYSVPGVPLPYLAPTAAPPQGTKRNRGSLPPAWNSLTEPWPGAYDQTLAANGVTGRKDIIQNVPYQGTTQTAQRYSTLDTVDPLDISRLGLTTSPFSTPATRAIAEITVNGGGIQPSGGIGRGRHVLPSLPGMGAATPLPTMADPLLEQSDPWGNMRMGMPGTPTPGLATGTPDGAAPEAPSRGGLLGLLLGLGGQGGGMGSGLASLLSGGAQTSPQQLAAMKQASTKAQDPALAKALAAGKKSYTPTNAKARGVLAQGAVMPTVAMNGNPIRNR